MHVFRDGTTRPTQEELEAKTESLSLHSSEEGIMLGVLAVPSWMTPSDFLSFVAPAVDNIGHLRIIRYVSKSGNTLPTSLLFILLQRFRSESFHGRNQVS